METKIIESVFTLSDARRASGKLLAKHRAGHIMEQIRTAKDRFQPSWALRNMIRALEIHSHNNTVEDWTRYYEARITLMARKYGRMTKSMERELT